MKKLLGNLSGIAVAVALLGTALAIPSASAAPDAKLKAAAVSRAI